MTEKESEKLEERALELKTVGNEYFKVGKYAEALNEYSEAIDLMPSAVLFSNRAFCHLNLENFGLALTDARASVKLDPGYIKGYHRLGMAYMQLSNFSRAKKIFKQVVDKRPNDKNARKNYIFCKQESRRILFEKAIASELREALTKTFQLDSLIIPDSYEGPKFKHTEAFNEDDETTIIVDDTFVSESIQWMFEQQNLHRKITITMLKKIHSLFDSLPTLLRIDHTTQNVPKQIKFNICGDTHGQFYDLKNIFEINGLPSASNQYLFNGDFVDRGSFSVEVVTTLFLLKLQYPDYFHLLRGNHETRNMNRIYGFDGEVKHKYDDKVLQMFTEVFKLIPLAAVLNNSVIIMHGGLFAQDGVLLEHIEQIDRKREPPDSTEQDYNNITSQEAPEFDSGILMSDILWSDPQEFPGRSVSKRGVGKSFGPDITAKFLKENNLDLVIRSHEVRAEGYLVEHDGKLITVFSAPNYCDNMGNKGAIVQFDVDTETGKMSQPGFKQFEAVSHPPIGAMAYAANMAFPS